MADYYWKGGSGSNGWNTAANWVNSSNVAYGSPPTASDTVIFDDTGGTDCVLDNTNLTANYIYIDSDFGHSITTTGLNVKVVMNGMQISKAAVFNLTAATEFEMRSTGTGWPSYTNGTTSTSYNHYIRYLIDSSPFVNALSRAAAKYDFNGKNYCLVDGVYPTIDRPGNLEAKAIFKDNSGGTFNSYGSVDLHDFVNKEFTSTSTNPDVFDYDKQFYFEGRFGSDSSLSYRIGENFKFGHTTVIFRAGTDSQGGHFQVPVKGDIISSGVPRGDITTNVFNVQYHKVIIRAPPEASQLRYCFIEDGRTLECNELVIESGGRLYGPAEGEQVASSKIKSVKRPTIQGDWNFKQIADGIYESIDNIPTLPVTEGGTGLNTLAVGRIPFGNGQLPLQTLSTLNYNTGSSTLHAVNAHFSGKLTVDGLIDPTGMEFSAVGSNPGTDAAKTIWVNSGDSNKLYFGSSEVGGNSISLNGSTANGILTFGNSTTADVEANITASGSTLSINNPSGSGSIELGGSAGGFIDLKGPFGNDRDLRIRTTGTGGTISTVSNADLGIDVGTGTVNVTGNVTVTDDLTLSGNFSAEDGNIIGNTFIAGYAAGDAILRTYNPADHLKLQTYDAGTSAFTTELEILNDKGGIQITNDLTVSGNLTVSGTTTTIDTANLNVEDKNITLNYATGDTSGSANGAGITIQDAVDASTDATILWDASNDKFDFSHKVNVAGDISLTGDVYLEKNKKIYFDSSDNHTYIYADTDSSEDLHIGADGHIELEPDNDLIVKVGSTEYVRFDGSSQRVGIGGIIPGAPLHVSKKLTGNTSTTLTGAQVFRVDSIDDGSSSDGPGFQIRLESTNDHNGANYEVAILGKGGSQRKKNIFGNYGFHEYWLAGNADGKKPIAYLRADGSTSAGATQYGVFRLLSTATAWAPNNFDPSGTTTGLQLNAGGDSYFMGGNVGIGDTTPSFPLEIRAASTFNTVNGHIMLTGDSATNGQGPQIVFSESGSSSSFAGAYIGHVRTGSNSTGDLVFATRATGGDATTVPTERMRILSDGNVGIGTTDPDAKLHVEGSVLIDAYEAGAGAGLFFREGFLNTNQPSITVQDHSGANPDGLAISAYDGISFRLDGSEKARFTSAGDLALNTTSAFTVGQTAQLTVAGGISWGADNTDLSYFRRLSAGNFQWQTYNSGNSGNIHLQPYGGNVGIGTTSPAFTSGGGLHIKNSSQANVRLEENAGEYFDMSMLNGDAYLINRVSDGFMTFRTNNTDRMRILSDGKVGIGTTSPDATLDIKVGGSGSRTSFNSVADDLVVDSTSDTGMTISSSNTATGNIFFADSDNNARGRIRYYHADNSLRIGTSGSEDFRIDGSGNVGIGVTSPSSKLDVNGTIECTGLKLQNGTLDYGGGKQQSTNLAVGWYTFAVVKGRDAVGSTQRGFGEFLINDVASSRHGSCRLNATHFFGAGNSIQVFAYNFFSTVVFNELRIKENSTYSGAALQVYVSNATNNLETYMTMSEQNASWVLLDTWLADSDDSGHDAILGYETHSSSWADFAAIETIDLSVFSAADQGGIYTSGGLKAEQIRNGKAGTSSYIYLSPDTDNSYILASSLGSDVTIAADDDLILHADDAIIFQTEGITKFGMHNGKMGIGASVATSAIEPLHVDGDIRADGTFLVEDQNADYYMIQLTSANGGTDHDVGINWQGTPNTLGLHNAHGDVNIRGGSSGTLSTPHLTVKSDGRVGIGTTSPGANLHVDRGSLAAPSLTFGASAGQIFQNENSEFAFGLDNDSPYSLWIQGRNSSNAARDISLQPLGGNIGIGTEAPETELHVAGSIAVDYALAHAGQTGQNRIIFENNTQRFQTAQSDRLTISSIGVVTIGGGLVTNSFQIGGGATVSTISTSTSLGTSNTTLATQGAIKSYVDSQVTGSANPDFKPVVFMDNNSVNVTTTETTIPFDNEVLDPSNNAFLASGTGNDGKIRLVAGGYYQVSYSIPINDDGSSGADRTRVFVDMQTSSSSTFTSPTTVPQSRAQVYTREASGGSGLSTTFIYEHTANDYIRLRIDAQFSTNISTEPGESQISIKYLGS